MKNYCRLIVLLFVLLWTPFSVFAAKETFDSEKNSAHTFEDDSYDEDDSMFDFDSIFEESEDAEVAEAAEAPTIQSTTQGSSCNWNMPLRFFGSFSAQAAVGTAINREPESTNTYPGVYATGTLGSRFTASDTMSIEASVQATLPTGSFGLSTLYMNYNLLDKAYLTIGKTSKTWSNSELVGTTETFSGTAIAIADIPLRHGANIQGILILNGTSFSPSAFEYNACIEFPLWGFSFKPYARLNYGSKYIRSGLYASGDLLGFHIASWATAAFKDDFITYSNSDFAIEFERHWEIPQKIGFIIGYESEFDMPAAYTQAIYFTAGWNHVAGSRYSPALKASYDINKKAATLCPAVSISDVLPHAEIYLAVPMMYGDTSMSFGSTTTYTLPGAGEGRFKAYGVAYIKISASF